MEWVKDEYSVSDEKKYIDWDFVISSLQKTYWAEDRPAAIIKKSFENSAVLSLLKGNENIGFARIVSDYSCFSWLCDVYIDPEHRGKGLGKFLMFCVKDHPSTRVRMTILATKDAHGLYEQYGFERREMMFHKKDYSDLL